MTTHTYESTTRRLDSETPIHYHVAGQGPALLLLHGSGPGVSGWDNFGWLFDAFAERFTLIAVDQPGFGASYRPAASRDYAAVSMAAIHQVLAAEGISRVHVLGNSLGGMVGLRLALDNSDLVDRVVMLGPGGLGFPVFGPQPSEGIVRLIEFTEEPTRERFELWLRAMVSDSSNLTPEFIERRWAAATEESAFEFTKEFYAGAKQVMKTTTVAPILLQATGLDKRVLMLSGRDDRTTPFESTLVPMRTLRNIELHVFSNAGHWVMIDQPQAFVSVVSEFLQRA